MIFILIGLGIALLASLNVKLTFKKYSKYGCDNGLTAEAVADRILRQNGVYDVQIRRVRGHLTDYYDPRNKVLCLSESVYGSYSVAAVGVAAHECGHAIQHSIGYKPLELRRKIAPLASLGSNGSYFLILLGLIFSMGFLVDIGILLFTAVVVFQLVTLPVEFDASKRACAALAGTNQYSASDLRGVKKVLTAAALTYLAALINAVLQLLRLLGIAGRRR